MSSTQSLSGKVALITGGSKGIGRAIALRLARDGAKVVVNYSSGAEAAEEVVNEIGAEKAIAIKADGGNVEEIAKLVDATVQKFGKIDILVACAGIMFLNELDKVTEQEFDKTFNLNVKGPLFLAQVSPPPTSLLNHPNNPIESSSTHDIRRSHHPLLHNTLCGIKRHAELPGLHLLQRRNRANDTSSLQRPCTQRHHGQRRRSRPYSD